jgi:hypothetical protein
VHDATRRAGLRDATISRMTLAWIAVGRFALGVLFALAVDRVEVIAYRPPDKEGGS